MKFNPVTRQLYTNANVLIKSLNCPYSIKWHELPSGERKESRRCSICKRDIIDTQGMTDEHVLNVVTQDSSVCLKVGLSQENVRVVNCNV